MASQIHGSGSASAASGTVIIGPIDVESGKVSVCLVSRTSTGTITTPTNPKLQYNPNNSLDTTTWVDVASGSVTPSGTASTSSETTKLDIICRQIRVVAAGAFAAGNATITVHGFVA